MENENKDRESVGKDVTDTEFAQEVVSQPNDTFSQDNKSEETGRGYGWGITGIVLSVLAFFLWPYLLAPIGIILGVVSVNQRSSLGWWAIVIGVLALILVTIFMVFAIPFRILF